MTYEFDNDEDIIQEEVYEPFVNEEAKKLLAFMKNRPKQKSKSSNTDLSLSSSNYKEHTFEIRSRSFSENKKEFNYEENETVTLSDGSKVTTSSKPSLTNNIENKTQTLN